MKSLTFDIPIRTQSEANVREHWAARAKRAKEHRGTAELFARQWDLPPLPAVITLTRIAPRRLDDDNNARALKSARDGIADAYGVDDGDSMYEWKYAQEKGAPKEYAVRVTISSRAAAEGVKASNGQ